MSKSGITSPKISPNRSLVNPQNDLASQRKSPPGSPKRNGSMNILSKSHERSYFARQNYSRYRDFIFSCIGSTIGHANVWRFPYLVYINGGGAFLIPYLLTVLCFGLPMTCLELYLGQLGGVGPGSLFGLMCPLLEGIGLAIVVSSLYFVFHNIMLLTYSLTFLTASLQETLPWSTCTNNWNTENCIPTHIDTDCRIKLDDYGAMYFNGSCLNGTDAKKCKFNSSCGVSPAEEYFYQNVLNKGYGSSDITEFSLFMALLLFLSWMVVVICSVKGVQIMDKVAYFTVLISTICLIVLFFCTVTLDGAGDGLLYFATPKFDKLGDIQVWLDAVSLVFWSMDNGRGTIITMASYNPFHNNCQRDAIIIVTIDTIISLLAGCSVFSALGFLSQRLHTRIDSLARSGIDLAFVILPESFSFMNNGSTFSSIFFIMIFTIGIDSQIWHLETIVSHASDKYSYFLSPMPRAILLISICVVCFFVGSVFCTKAGIYIFFIFVEHTSTWTVGILALFECVCVFYIYGYDRFFKDIVLIIGCKPNYYWRITWMATSPLFILSFLFVSLDSLANGTEIDELVGWLLSSSVAFCIPCVAVYRIIVARLNNIALKKLVLPSKTWCPRSKSTLAMKKQDLVNAQQGKMGEFELSEEKTRRLLKKTDDNKDATIKDKAVITEKSEKRKVLK